jgi:quercetin dioxygenase-like cupin family protein
MSVQQQARLRQQPDISARPFEGGAVQWLVDGALGAQHVMSYRLVVDPGSSTSHSHAAAEEALYVLQGEGEIRVEDEANVVMPGRAVYVPQGAEHSYVNTGAVPLVIVGAMAPPIDPSEIRPAVPRISLEGISSSALDEAAQKPTMMEEARVTPTLMGERSFRVLVSPAVGCQQMTQFTGVIPTGRAPLHAHPHEEAVYILAGTGRLWIEDQPAGDLRPGSVVFFPIGIRHTLENTGREDMKVLGAFSPAGSPEAKLPPAR